MDDGPIFNLICRHLQMPISNYLFHMFNDATVMKKKKKEKRKEGNKNDS